MTASVHNERQEALVTLYSDIGLEKICHEFKQISRFGIETVRTRTPIYTGSFPGSAGGGCG